MASTVFEAPVFGNPYPVFGIPNAGEPPSKVDAPSPAGVMTSIQSEAKLFAQLRFSGECFNASEVSQPFLTLAPVPS